MTVRVRSPKMTRRYAGILTVAALVVGATLLLALPALAATSVTVQSGGCSGGGSLFCYNPENASGATGSAATWSNQSGAQHTVTSCTASACPGAAANTGSDTFDLSLGSSNGSSASFAFTHAGTYTYYCKIHGYAAMHGTITVAATQTPPPAVSPSGTAPPASGSGPATVPATGAGAGAGRWVLLIPLGLILLGVGLVARGRTR